MYDTYISLCAHPHISTCTLVFASPLSLRVDYNTICTSHKSFSSPPLHHSSSIPRSSYSVIAKSAKKKRSQTENSNILLTTASTACLCREDLKSLCPKMLFKERTVFSVKSDEKSSMVKLATNLSTHECRTPLVSSRSFRE